MTFSMEVEPLVETLCGSVLLPQPAKSASDISAAMPTAIILFLFILYTPLYKIFLGMFSLGTVIDYRLSVKANIMFL